MGNTDQFDAKDIWSSVSSTQPIKPLPVRKASLLVEEKQGDEVLREGELTPVRAAFWAKPQCRQCHGRGLQHWSKPNGWSKTVACDCVLRRMAKR